MKKFIILSEKKDLEDLIKMKTKTYSLYQILKQKGIELININFKKNIFISEDSLIVEGENIDLSDILGVTFASMGEYVINYDFLNLVDFFEQNGIKTIHTTGNLKYFSKINQSIFFTKNGVNIPKTMIFYKSNLSDFEIKDLKQKFKGKGVIKTGIGANGYNVGLMDINDDIKINVSNFLKNCNYNNTGFLIQEYIPGCKGKDLRTVIINGEIVYSFKRINTNGDFRSNITSQGGKVLEINIKKDLKKLHIEKIFQNIKKINKLNFSYYCVDFMLVQDNVYISEINVIGNYFYPQFEKNGNKITEKILKNIFKIN